MKGLIFLLAVLCVFVACAGSLSLDRHAEAARQPQTVVDLASFGARPNDPRVNSRAAFQSALEKLKSLGGGTLSIPGGDYYLDFSDVASDVDPRDSSNTSLLRAKNLKKEKLILVPPRVMVQGILDRSGNPITRIHWSVTSIPLISFINSDGSGAENLAFVFDGEQPQFFPWSQEDFLEEAGYKSRWLGGPYELSAVIYTVGSGNLRFENLSFQSSRLPADNAHTFAFGIVSSGKGPVPQPDSNSVKTLLFGARLPGGGLSECVSNNIFRSLRFRDFIMGILAIGQCDAVFENIEGNNRGSWYRSFDPSHETGPELEHIGPPGHLIYLSFQNAYDVERTPEAPSGRQVFHTTTRNKSVTLRNIREGAETLSNMNSLGTLALKDMEGGIVTDVVSHHPLGLIQSMVDAHDVLLENLTWSTDRDICGEEHPPTNCRTPVITLEPSPPESESPNSSSVNFKNVKLQSPRRSIIFKISQEGPSGPLSQNINVDGLTIECNLQFGPNQQSAQGIITVRSVASHLTNVHILPVLPNGAPSDRQNYPAVIQSRSQDTSVEMTIERGRGNGNSVSGYKCVVEDQRTPASRSDNRCQVNQ